MSSISQCPLPPFTAPIDFRGLACPPQSGNVSLGLVGAAEGSVASSAVVTDAASKANQLGGTQFIDLCQEEYRTAAGQGCTASADMQSTPLNLDAHRSAREKLADACDRTTKCAQTPVNAKSETFEIEFNVLC